MRDLVAVLEKYSQYQRNDNSGTSEVPQSDKTILVCRKYFLEEAYSKRGDILWRVEKDYSTYM